MSYDFDVQMQQDHIRVEVSGDRATGDAVADADLVGQQLVEVCRNSKIDRVMLVLRLSGRASAIDVFKIITNAQGYGYNHDIKTAFVDLNAESIDDVKFAETVAFNRAYRVRVFDNETDARQWLLNS